MLPVEKSSLVLLCGDFTCTDTFQSQSREHCLHSHALSRAAVGARTGLATVLECEILNTRIYGLPATDQCTLQMYCLPGVKFCYFFHL